MEIEKQNASQFWSKSPAGWSHAPNESPGEKEYFEKVKHLRNTHELRTLLDTIPFKSFAKKKVLELGCGQGFDAYEFCLNQCDYTGIDIATENIKRAKQNLSYYGFNPEIHLGDAENLPFSDHTYDIVYSNGVLHHTPNMKQSFKEANRVLKKDGEFYVILYHKHSIFYILTVFLFEYILKGGIFKYSMKKRRSTIESSINSEDAPAVLVNVYTKRKLKKLLKQSDFHVFDLWVRKLELADFPCQRLMKHIWPNLSPRFVHWLEKHWGWYVVGHAIKKPHKS